MEAGLNKYRATIALITLAEQSVNPIAGNLAAWTRPEEGGVLAIRTWTRRLRKDKRGATAIEYGLIVALIAIAMMGGLRTLGGGAGGMWTNLSQTANDKM